MVILHRQLIKKVLNLVKTENLPKMPVFLYFPLKTQTNSAIIQTIFTDTLLH